VSYLFKIEFTKKSDYLNDDYDRLSEHEKENISNLESEYFFDYDDLNDNYVCIIVTSYIEIKKYTNILKNNLIEYTISDLSTDIISGEIDLEILLKDNFISTNQIKFSIFIEDVNLWILKNTNIDIILDRISRVGMSNLKEVEKDYLKNYKI
jgi:hypothetical protein